MKLALFYCSVLLISACRFNNETIVPVSKFNISKSHLKNDEQIEILESPENRPRKMSDTYILYVVRVKSTGETVNLLSTHYYDVAETGSICYFEVNAKHPLHKVYCDGSVTADIFTLPTAIGEPVYYSPF